MEDEAVVSILLVGDEEVGKSAFFARLVKGTAPSVKGPLPQLRDSNQPFVFNVWNNKKNYRLECYDTASPENYALLRPDVIVMCYSIADRETLNSLHGRWKYMVETHFNYDEALPVMCLGLKRDLRREGDPAVIFAQEALRIAQEMRCDRYAECSAITGELCKEVFEDLVHMAVGAAHGDGKTPGTHCTIL